MRRSGSNISRLGECGTAPFRAAPNGFQGVGNLGTVGFAAQRPAMPQGLGGAGFMAHGNGMMTSLGGGTPIPMGGPAFSPGAMGGAGTPFFGGGGQIIGLNR